LSFDPASLFLSLVVSGVGFVLFVYGKKQDRWPQLTAGLVLMVYPYFVGSALPMLLVAAGVIGGLWLAVRAGY
jgi:hypothetical protein